ncbi:hypothetical protein [Gottfriedia luciferensis]|uniref:hypothetical protein n=1 Tax=Gottfriedia luciferensis TaxID=178774 RepID=UPI000B44236A|nr:hypothetical protein [Gottfriedia luciferensis]
MKIKWVSNVMSSLFALTLIFGSVSIASAKGPEGGKSHEKPAKDHEQTQKKIVIKSNVGKNLEKRLKTSEASINNITKSINAFFGVNEDGTTDKTLSKKSASSTYNSYKGKLNAEINKLRAVDKQLAKDKKKYKSISAELEALELKSKELQKLAADEITRVKTLTEKASAPKTTEEETQPSETTTQPTEPKIEPIQPTT